MKFHYTVEYRLFDFKINLKYTSINTTYQMVFIFQNML